jgi:hypothetical protein
MLHHGDELVDVAFSPSFGSADCHGGPHRGAIAARMRVTSSSVGVGLAGQRGPGPRIDEEAIAVARTVGIGIGPRPRDDTAGQQKSAHAEHRRRRHATEHDFICHGPPREDHNGGEKLYEHTGVTDGRGAVLGTDVANNRLPPAPLTEAIGAAWTIFARASSISSIWGALQDECVTVRNP